MEESDKMGKAIGSVFQEEEKLSNMIFDGEEFARAVNLEMSFTAPRHHDWQKSKVGPLFYSIKDTISELWQRVLELTRTHSQVDVIIIW